MRKGAVVSLLLIGAALIDGCRSSPSICEALVIQMERAQSVGEMEAVD